MVGKQPHLAEGSGRWQFFFPGGMEFASISEVPVPVSFDVVILPGQSPTDTPAHT